MVLNLHGEVPDVDVMNAEEAFLPTLKGINERFPKLRIVLEHCTTSAAVETVRSCGPTVAGTLIPPLQSYDIYIHIPHVII